MREGDARTGGGGGGVMDLTKSIFIRYLRFMYECYLFVFNHWVQFFQISFKLIMLKQMGTVQNC